MIASLKAKLRQQRGASLILAMAVFLLCVVTSSILLTTAVSNARMLNDLSEQEQAYQTMRSAALLLRSELSGYSYQRSASTIVHSRDCGLKAETDAPHPLSGRQIQQNGVVAYEQLEYADGSADVAGSLTRFTRLMDSLIALRGGQAITSTLTLPDDTFAPVSVTWQCLSNYDIRATLTMEDGAYSMTVRFPATILRENEATSEVLHHTYGDEDEELCDYTLTTYVTAVVWGDGEITKGVQS